jgi:hypothetical protein
VTMQYLAGELSAWLQRLQAVSGPSGAAQISELRYEVEACPPAWLAPAMRRAVVLADGLCWDSLSRGDAISFARQAAVSVDLRRFGVCARLLEDC